MATVTLSKTEKRTITFQWRRGMVGFKTFLIYTLLMMCALFFLFPLVWMMGTSLKTIDEVSQAQLKIVPEEPQWDNYSNIVQRKAFYRSYVNSIFVTTMVLLGTVSSVSLVAYSFSRIEWRGRNLVFAMMMGTLMLPYQATLVPQYVLFYKLEWLRTFNPITIPGYFAGGAVLIFLMRQFMLTIPKELDEAAMIDGANPLQIWWYIIMPLCRPAVATIALFLFVGSWNNLLQPLIYLQRAELYTMPIFIAQLNNLQDSPIPWQNIMTASTLFVIPILVVFILTQRYFTEGITLTGTKG